MAPVAGLGFGFLLGRQHPPAARPAVAVATPASPELNPIVATGRSCAITKPGPGGKADLELGTEIQNRSGHSVTLETPGVGLPMGGLQVAEPPTLRACGELPGITETVLSTGEGSWLSVRLHVPGGACPAALPVLFVVNYLAGADGHGQASVGGFNDLGKVSYPTC